MKIALVVLVLLSLVGNAFAQAPGGERQQYIRIEEAVADGRLVCGEKM